MIPSAEQAGLDPADLRPAFADRPAVAIPSARASFFVAFFGGPFAAVLFAARIEQLLGSLRRRLWLYFGLVAVVLAILVAVYGSVDLEQGVLPKVSRTVRWGIRGFGLVVWGLLYLRLRPFHLAAESSGAIRSPWRDAVVCMLLAGILSVAAVLASALVRS